MPTNENIQQFGSFIIEFNFEELENNISLDIRNTLRSIFIGMRRTRRS